MSVTYTHECNRCGIIFMSDSPNFDGLDKCQNCLELDYTKALLAARDAEIERLKKELVNSNRGAQRNFEALELCVKKNKVWEEECSYMELLTKDKIEAEDKWAKLEQELANERKALELACDVVEEYERTHTDATFKRIPWVDYFRKKARGDI